MRFTIALRLSQSFALEKSSRLFGLVHITIGIIHGLCDHISVDTFNFEISDYTAPAEFLIVAAEGGIGGSVTGVVEVFLIFQALDDAFDNRFIRAAGAQLPLQFGNRMHSARQ